VRLGISRIDLQRVVIFVFPAFACQQQGVAQIIVRLRVIGPIVNARCLLP
jgi:hypothetical protein